MMILAAFPFQVPGRTRQLNKKLFHFQDQLQQQKEFEREVN